MSHNAEYIALLISKHILGSLTEEEKETLQAWLAEEERHQRLFERLTSLESFEQEAKRFVAPEKEIVRARLHQNLFGRKEKSTFARAKWLSIAAILAIAIAFSIAYFEPTRPKLPASIAQLPENPLAGMDQHPGGKYAVLTLSNHRTLILDSSRQGLLAEDKDQKLIRSNDSSLVLETTHNPAPGESALLNTLSASRSGVRIMHLPDGSKVWLDVASSLRLLKPFNAGKRIVLLWGQAFFDIVKDIARPFIIYTGQVNDQEPELTKVEALGTQFNVRAYPDEGPPKITVFTGSVKLSQGDDSCTVLPGEQAVRHPGYGFEVKKIMDPEEILAWRKGFVEFSDTSSIRTIMHEATRIYGIIVIYQGKVDGRFQCAMGRSISLEVFLHSLEQTGEIRFHQQADTVLVQPVRDLLKVEKSAPGDRAVQPSIL